MDTSTLVIGAGPYGIGIAQELWHRGVEAVVVGEPFELWHHHTPSGMRLRSDLHTSEIYSPDRRYSLRRFLASRAGAAGGRRKERTTVEGFREYLDEVVRRLPFPVEPTRVERLDAADGRFAARLADGRSARSRAVVLATGIGPHRHLPEELRRLPAERVLHTWEVRRIEALSGRRVLVVGAGQSAAEAVAHLREENEVLWAMRHRPVFFSEPVQLPTPLFKLVLFLSPRFHDLPPRARLALSRLLFRATITPALRGVYLDPRVRKVVTRALDLRAEDGHLVSPSIGRLDFVVAATGYRCGLSGIAFLADSVRSRLGGADGVPVLDRTFQTAVPGLYVAGGLAEAAFGPAQRFILGSWHAAPRIGRAVANRK